MTKEKEIQKYMEKLGISKEEATQLWEDDHDDYESPEMKEMERKAKEIKRYEKSNTPRKKSTKERKVDETKKRFINGFRVYLEGCGATVTPIKTEAEMHFTFENENYTVKIIKHRAPK